VPDSLPQINQAHSQNGRSSTGSHLPRIPLSRIRRLRGRRGTSWREAVSSGSFAWLGMRRRAAFRYGAAQCQRRTLRYVRNRWADEFERAHRTPACLRGAHDDCPHLYGFGGGLNPRRLRLEFGAGLCKCECHSSCPVTCRRVTVQAQTWRQSCSCPGAAAERARQDEAGEEFPDFREEMAKYQRASQLRREAAEAVRARAAGKSREELKDLYIAELRSRGLNIPREEILDANIDAITGNYLPAFRLLGQSLASLGRLFGAFRPPR